MIIARRIVSDIRRNQHTVGAKLPPERVMLEDYQVGRGTLRESLRFLELQGRIEAARSSDTDHVRGLFEEIGVQVRMAGDELMAFSALATRRDRDGAEVARAARQQASALRISHSGD